jgi:hypothetical protein
MLSIRTEEPIARDPKEEVLATFATFSKRGEFPGTENDASQWIKKGRRVSSRLDVERSFTPPRKPRFTMPKYGEPLAETSWA